jgi:DNA-binding IclR family transcriptional regulator
VSAPVFGEAGQIVATVSVLGPSERLSDAKIAELVPTLLRAAKAITDRVLLEPVASTVP